MVLEQFLEVPRTDDEQDGVVDRGARRRIGVPVEQRQLRDRAARPLDLQDLLAPPIAGLVDFDRSLANDQKPLGRIPLEEDHLAPHVDFLDATPCHFDERGFGEVTEEWDTSQGFEHALHFDRLPGPPVVSQQDPGWFGDVTQVTARARYGPVDWLVEED